MSARIVLASLAALALASAGPRPAAAQAAAQVAPELGRAEALRRHHPALHDLLVRVESAHGVLLGEFAREAGAARARGDRAAGSGFESDLVARLTALIRKNGPADDAARGAAAGYGALGARGAEIVRWGQAFQREVLSVLADPAVTDPGAALDDVVLRYASRPEVALPSAPKNMDVLYGHPYALAFRTAHPDLDGVVWAGHWLRLAATEPMTDLAAGEERGAGLDTVTTRYLAKLGHGEPPNAFPSELPLAPAIAPGLIWLSPESAMIWDNLSLLLEVLADVLASPETADVPGSIDAALDFFLDADLAVTNQDEWEIMALRHGIFFQGGFPLAVMTENERNVGGHAAHLSGGVMLMTIPGMPRR